MVHGRSVATPQSPQRAVRVQEFYPAESRTSSVGEEQQGVRWMARCTESLRMTANRGATAMDRMLDSFGIQHGSYGHLQRTQPGAGVQQQLNFAPPEEIPAPSHPPVPLSWSSTTRPQEQPLFSNVQVDHMRQAVREHPMIYGPGSEVDSERSSRLQQEVQRPMEEYTARYQEHVLRLEREVQSLRRKRASGNGEGADGTVPQGPGVSAGNDSQVPVQSNVPQGPGVSAGSQAQVLVQSSVPQTPGVSAGSHPQVPVLAYLLEVILKYRCNRAFHKALAYLQEVIFKYTMKFLFETLLKPSEFKGKIMLQPIQAKRHRRSHQ